MTRKDYVKIARVLESVKHAQGWGAIVELMANMLSADNPNFQRSKVYAACGL